MRTCTPSLLRNIPIRSEHSGSTPPRLVVTPFARTCRNAPSITTAPRNADGDKPSPRPSVRYAVRAARSATLTGPSGREDLHPKKSEVQGGIARAGHSRPAHWRGGAKAHGPKNNTDYGNVKLNKKVRKQALQHALSQKLLEGNLIVLDQLHALSSQDLADMLAPWDIAGRYGMTALILDHYYPDKSDSDDNKEATSYRGIPVNRWGASGILFKIKVGNDHLKYDKLVLTLSALQQLEQRLKDV
jgi:large subunit ribosomal protein L4